MWLKMRCGNEDFYALKKFELSPMGHIELWKHFKQVHNKPRIIPAPFLALLIFHFYIEEFGCSPKESSSLL